MNGKEQQRSASAQPKSKPEFKKKASQDLKTATQVQPLPTIPTKQKPEKAPEIAIVKTAEAMQEEPLTKEASKPESNERKGRIFLKNLVYDTNEKMLRKLCTPFGEIKEINIPVDPSTNRPRGFAFVEFASKNSALKAVGSLNDSNWKGRKLTADLSVDKRRYEAASTTQPAIQPLSTAPATGDQIEVVPSKPALDEKPSKAKKEKKVVPKEETEDPEMDELDQIVLRNIAAMGNEFEFDEEEESENKEEEVHDDNGEPKASMHEVDVKGEISKSKIKTKLVENVDDLLKAAEKEKQKEVKKKHEEEDLSQTCFIRGVSFDIREEELLDFFRKNVGQIHYLKLVKFKADANKHNGNGFVKFKDPKVMQRLLEMTDQFNKGEYVPKPKDPKMEVGGIRLQFYPALKKTEAQDLKVKREQELAAKNEPEDKKKRHNKQKTMEELIAADKSGKRRLVFSKIGFFENIEESKLSEADLSQRKNHREEKKAKMQNPNYFVSDKRVLLKNIDRLLTDLQIKSLATEVLKSKLTPKEIKKAKIFSDVKLIESRSEESTGKSSGLAFIEFYKPEYADAFLSAVSESSVARRFNHKRWPIIEFAFEDVRIYKKIHAVKEKPKADPQGDREVAEKIDLIKQKEDKQKAKLSSQNDKMYIRVKLDEMGQNPALATRQAVAELVKLARKNRGLKQRIKKRFPQFFSEQQPEDSRPKSASKSREPRGKSEGSQLKKRIDPMRKEEDRILKKVKKQKAHKKNEEDHDFLDVAQIYPRNLKQSMRRN